MRIPARSDLRLASYKYFEQTFGHTHGQGAKLTESCWTIRTALEAAAEFATHLNGYIFICYNKCSNYNTQSNPTDVKIYHLKNDNNSVAAC